MVFFISGDSLSTVEAYNPSIGSWVVTEAMSTVRSRVGVASLHGRLYAIGGYNGNERLATVEAYDSSTNKWSMVASMSRKRRFVFNYVLNMVNCYEIMCFVFQCCGRLLFRSSCVCLRWLWWLYFFAHRWLVTFYNLQIVPYRFYNCFYFRALLSFIGFVGENSVNEQVQVSWRRCFVTRMCMGFGWTRWLIDFWFCRKVWS